MARAKKETALTPEERLQAALVPDWEWPYKLPENWCWTYLGVVSEIVMGQSPAGKSTTNDSSYMPLIGGAADMGELYPQVSRFTKTPTKQSQTDDVILSIRATLGRPIFSDGIYCLGRGVVAFRSSIVTKEFLRYFFIDQENYLYQNATGTTFAQVDSKTLKSMPFPLPPFHEQRRIVRRVESLFTKLDEAKDKAQKVVDEFKTRKAAILHKAFTGELTAKWREEHNISKTTWGEKKWGDFLQSIEAGKNWSAEGRPPEGTEFGVVKVSAVTWGEFDELESKTCVVAEQWNSKTQIHKGDFLFSRANTLQLVGNCVIVRNISKRLMLSDKILRFKFDEIAHPRFVLYFTRSRIYREQVEQLASGNQDGMRNISQKNLKLVSFPIPTVVEQIEIISILDRAFAKEQQAKEAAEAVLDQIDLMKKSILARAFHGELGTNDPNEESAVELLKRGLEKK